MPATLFSELEFSANQHNNKVIEDSRALQVALELSMLYMNGEQRQQKVDNNTLSGGQNNMDQSPMAPNYIPHGFPEEPRNKKSQNMTECVPVPSSEHVAEIVGRQGNITYYWTLLLYHIVSIYKTPLLLPLFLVVLCSTLLCARIL